MAQRQHLYEGFTHVLDPAGMAAGQLQVTVASLVDEQNGPYKPWGRPAIPGTASETQPLFNDEFHPRVRGGSVQGLGSRWDGFWSNNRTVILRFSNVRSSRPPTNTAQSGLRTYIDKYLDYWLNEVRDDATINKLSFRGWEEFL